MANIINGTDTGSGGLITTGDSSDELQLQTAETARVTLTNTAVVVNEDGNDVDFRVEGDTNANLLFVDASTDRVGIGTSSPSQQLHIANSDDAIVLIESTGSDATDDANIQLKTTNGTFTIQNDRSIGTSGALTFAGNTSDNIVIDHNSGNVGIGTSGPTTQLHVYKAATNRQALLEGTTGSPYLEIKGNSGSMIVGNESNGAWVGSATSQALVFKTNDTERMRIDSSGNLLLGTTGTNGRINVNFGVANGVTTTLQTFSDNINASHFQIKRYDAVVGGFWEGRLQITSTEAGGYSGIIIEMRGKDGSVWMPEVYNDSVTGRDMYISSSGQLGYLSSIRASKTNIEDLPSIDWLYQLNPVKFQYRTKDEEGNYTETAEAEIQYGLIAEDVEAVNADLVFYNDAEGGQELAGVQYSRLIAPLLQAVKDLKAELDTVKAELATLKG